MPDYLKAGLASMAIVLLTLPIMIPALRRLKFGQYVRSDGPQSHLGKSGTPTMGGLVFLLSIPGIMMIGGYPAEKNLPAGFLTLAMGLLGFADDIIKVKRRRAEGLTARQKLSGQIVISLLFAYVLWKTEGGRVWAPFIRGDLDLGLLYIPLAAFIVIATANGVNFTDGLDGLCAGVTFLVAVVFLLLCRAWGLSELTWFAGALAGTCLGFLCFNIHPAKVFMGDTGALALGGAVAALALLSGTAMLLPLLGIVYVAEVASVILQVIYFRRTGGKRLFRMSPIHHHFELCGWKESRVDAVFWLVTAFAGMGFLWILL